MKKLKKKCVICGRKLKIMTKNKRGHYSGGNYFGRFELYKRYRNTGRYAKFGKMKVDIVEGIGKPKEVEYWECNKCFRK